LSLANWDREVMQMRTLRLRRASKPPDVTAELGSRGARRGERCKSSTGKGTGPGPFEKSLKHININGVGLSTIHNIRVS
jgi:hypothetical protein